MRNEEKRAARAALVLSGAGAAWPSVYGALTAFTLSPLERALRASWCGAAPHQAFEVLGHCPACWSGAAALFLAATWLFVNFGFRARLEWSGGAPAASG